MCVCVVGARAEAQRRTCLAGDVVVGGRRWQGQRQAHKRHAHLLEHVCRAREQARHVAVVQAGVRHDLCPARAARPRLNQACCVVRCAAGCVGARLRAAASAGVGTRARPGGSGGGGGPPAAPPPPPTHTHTSSMPALTNQTAILNTHACPHTQTHTHTDTDTHTHTSHATCEAQVHRQVLVPARLPQRRLALKDGLARGLQRLDD
jgi:hypothetical protein